MSSYSLTYLCVSSYLLDFSYGSTQEKVICISWIHHKNLQKVLDEDPEELDITQLEHQIDSVKGSDAAYLTIHDTISEEYANAINPDEEQNILEQHEEEVDKALSLISRLIALRTVHTDAADLQERHLDHKMESNPHKAYDQAIQKVEEAYQKLHTTLKKSTFPKSHKIRRSVLEIHSHIVDLTSTERLWTPALPVTLLLLNRSGCPNFDGDPLHWSTFWEQFLSAVHDNSHLDRSPRGSQGPQGCSVDLPYYSHMRN